MNAPALRLKHPAPNLHRAVDFVTLARDHGETAVSRVIDGDVAAALVHLELAADCLIEARLLLIEAANDA